MKNNIRSIIIGVVVAGLATFGVARAQDVWGGGAPGGSIGSVIANLANAVGILPIVNGGTGAASLAGANIAVTTGATFSGSITFSGSSPDVTAASGENLEIVAAGAGNLLLTGGPTAGDVRVSTGNAFTITTNSTLRWTFSTAGVTTTTTPIVFSGVATDIQTSGSEDLTLAPGGRVFVNQAAASTTMLQVTGQSGQTGQYIAIQAEDDTTSKFSIAPNGVSGSMAFSFRPILTGATADLLQFGSSGQRNFYITNGGAVHIDLGVTIDSGTVATPTITTNASGSAFGSTTTNVIDSNVINTGGVDTALRLNCGTLADTNDICVNLYGVDTFTKDGTLSLPKIAGASNSLAIVDSSGGTDATFGTSTGNVSISLVSSSNIVQMLAAITAIGTTVNTGTTALVLDVSDSQTANISAGTQLWGVYGDGFTGENTAAAGTCASNALTVTAISPTMTVNPNGAACTLTMATTNVTTIAKDVDVEVVVNGSVGAGVVTFASTNFTHLPTSCTTTGIVNGDAVHFRWSATLSKWVYLGGCA